MLRRLRISASVFFAVLTVALCVLWVRSYRCMDGISAVSANNAGTEFISSVGGLSYVKLSDATGFQPAGWWRSASILPAWNTPQFGWRTVRGMIRGNILQIWMPYWFVTAISGSLALVACPWTVVSYRFSLRTMLIATTLVAVVLGIVAYSTR